MSKRKIIQLVDVPSEILRSLPQLDRRVPIFGAFSDHTGKQISNGTTIGLAGVLDGMSMWLCKCNCGRLFLLAGRRLSVSGTPYASCGCTQHGCCEQREYRAWNYLRKRHKGDIVTEWSRFQDFMRDMGKCPRGKKSVVRLDVTKPYGPANCKWGTRMESVGVSQALHHRPITYRGRTMLMTEWARQLGITRERMRQRLNTCEEYGIDVGEALTTPPGLSMPSLPLNRPVVCK